ncbi:acyltransferase [Burkholderia plantarii]|uniref:Putative sialic acid synthase-like protein n=1 Tax=Burkholderia plantarii TaxID=41899 RepID=A0A0B6S2T5_BURPL|nr:acyltransferase [Burkholderia plantarii]AJK49973.1 putative sialic acid synthase-like protein [Burkholderia plantarii]WLE63205.1 acyltransferase [Burkholderia plantarii]
MSRLPASLARFGALRWNERINALEHAYFAAKTRLWYARVFGEVGRGSVIFPPCLLANVHHASLGERVLIRAGARIELVVADPARPPALSIGSDVNIEQNVHIVCGSSIEIQDAVTITGGCAIVDVEHPYDDVHDPVRIGMRLRMRGNRVMIGAGSFIGFNSIILPNVVIGRCAVVGSHSVVTRDVPDHCVVAGNPARIIRRYNFHSQTWESSRS